MPDVLTDGRARLAPRGRLRRATRAVRRVHEFDLARVEVFYGFEAEEHVQDGARASRRVRVFGEIPAARFQQRARGVHVEASKRLDERLERVERERRGDKTKLDEFAEVPRVRRATLERDAVTGGCSAKRLKLVYNRGGDGRAHLLGKHRRQRSRDARVKGEALRLVAGDARERFHQSPARRRASRGETKIAREGIRRVLQHQSGKPREKRLRLRGRGRRRRIVARTSVVRARGG